MDFSYKGNIDPKTVFETVEAQTSPAVLLDVRTKAEFDFVGFPKLTDMSRYALIEWVQYPEMSKNVTFVEQCKALISMYAEPVQNVYIICRSGKRSHAAGLELEQAQTTEESAQPIAVYNVMGGFEGDRDPQAGQRSHHDGWKFEGLPWHQS